MSDSGEWDGRSDGLRYPRRKQGKTDTRSDILLRPAESDGDALSDCLAEQPGLFDTATTFDSRLLGMQRRHEEELEAVRKHYRTHQSADIENLLAAKTREREAEIARLQEELSEQVRNREEELEQVIGQLREEADGTNVKLDEARQEYESLQRAHEEMVQKLKRVRAEVSGRLGENTKELGDSEHKPTMPLFRNLKKGIDRFAGNLAILMLIGVAFMIWQKVPDDGSGHSLGLGLFYGTVVAAIAGQQQCLSWTTMEPKSWL